MQLFKLLLLGCAAGAVNGIFGAGGGMIVIPLLAAGRLVEENALFPTSICIMLPICLVSLVAGSTATSLPLTDAFPYLLGGCLGGLLAGWFGQQIPVHWLHRALGVMLLWGGLRYLC